jgi:hypothetical protein
MAWLGPSAVTTVSTGLQNLTRCPQLVANWEKQRQGLLD